MPGGGRFTPSYARIEADPAGLAFLDALFEQSDVGVGIWDRSLRFTRVNPALASMNGLAAEDHIGHHISEVLPELGPHLESLFEEVLATQTAAAGLEITGQTPASPGEDRHWLASYYPLVDDEGHALGIGSVIVDITDRKQAQAALEARERAAEFLLEAGSVLAGSLDYKQTLRNIAHLAVPFVADWCVVDMLQPNGSLRRVALAHVDPEKEQLAWELTRRYPSGPNAFEGSPKAVRSGNRELVPEIRDSLLERIAKDDEHLRLLRELGLRSLMIVPLVARGRTMGAMTFVSAQSGRRFGGQDLVLAEQLAERCALAVDNARLYGESAYIAQSLQRSLLPPRLPKIPGVEVAARYRAAGEGNEVGGDFYDFFPTGDGEWGVAIGDVTGRGPDAAAETALARHTIHAAAAFERRPSSVLAALNEATADTEAPTLLTAVYAAIAPDARRVELSVGGHPLPLIVRADGCVEEAGKPGRMLGIDREADLHDTVHELHAGDVLVLFTDGLFETRPIEKSLGETGVATVLARAAGRGAEEIADLLVAEVERRTGEEGGDDMAVIVLRFPPRGR